MSPCLLVFLFAAAPSQTAAAAPPNIVLILADDLGATDLACYGADLHETPRLDSLAKQSATFTQAYSAAPVCSPTRAALMTGKHPARLGITIWSEGSLAGPKNRKLLQGESQHDLALSEVTLAERLHEAGYATALIGKWHLGDADHAPETQGFDLNIGGTRWGAPQSFFWPYRGAGRFGTDFRYVPGLPLGKPGDYLTDKLTDAAISFIDAARERPFFLYLAHHAPHTPIESPAAEVEHFRAKLAPGLKHQNATYAAMIKNLDTNVGRVLDHLQSRGLAENTIVIFTSDNGGYIGADRKSSDPTPPCTNNHPLRSGKGSLYEGGIRVPLLIRGPQVTAGHRSQPTITTDLFFTLLAATVDPSTESNPKSKIQNLKSLSPADGLDIMPVLKSPNANLPRDTLYWLYPHYYETTTPVSAIRSGDWKLLEYFEDQSIELYNLATDPTESKNLAPSDPNRATDLQKQLHTWRVTTSAKLPTPNPAFRPNLLKTENRKL